MIDFIVGSITHKTSLLGALRHVGVSSTLRRRIKHTGICMVNGQRADTRDFVVAGDHIHVELPEKIILARKPSRFPSPMKMTIFSLSINRQACSCILHRGIMKERLPMP